METRVMRLRMELKDSRGMSIRDDGALALAGAKKGIIREVLVTGDMMLSDLHFLIQRLFGWKNLHLHRFSLREPDFNWVTEGAGEILSELSGALFKVVDDTGFEWNWHRRYGGAPLKDKGRFSIEESFILNRIKAASSGARLTEFRAYPDESGTKSVRGGYNILLDRLSLNEIFCVRDKGEYVNAYAPERERWKLRMRESIADCMRRLEDMSRERSEEYRGAVSAVRSYQAMKSDYMALLELRALPPPGENSMARETLDEIIVEHEDKLESYALAASPLTQRLSPAVTPIFSHINYWYDRGDEWCIGISCVNILIKDTDEEAFTVLGSGRAEQRILESAGRVSDTLLPALVHSEGYDLVDDIGGVQGYFDMLRAFEEPEREEGGILRQMAAVYGWSGY